MRVLACLVMAAMLTPSIPALALPFLTPRVITEYDHSAPLSHRTYSWSTVKLQVPEYEAQIRSLTDKYLQTRGWQLVPTGGSATVFALGDVREEATLTSFYAATGSGWTVPWGPQGLGPSWKPLYGEDTFNALNKAQNNLVLDIFDTGGHQLLFRGVQEDDFSNTPKKNAKRLKSSLKQMFKKFPPKK